VCPLRWLWIQLPGTRRFVAQDYTRGRRASQFEIFIPSIRFSDAAIFPGSWDGRVSGYRTADFVHLAGQRIMPSGQRFGLGISGFATGTSDMTERPPMEINVRESAGVSVLEVHGRLTIGEPSDQLHAALQSVVQKGAKKVVVILNGIPQIDSSGISTLVRISIQLARDGGVMRLVCGPGRVRDALTVTRLVEAIPTFESESAALSNFA
jgi:anti-anti-sigma factor